MQMDVFAPKFELTAGLDGCLAVRVEHAIGVYWNFIRGVMVQLLDVNGERGCAGKACRIVVWLNSRGSVIVEAVDRDLYTSIAAASAKLRVALGRRLGRRLTLQRECANRSPRVYPPGDRHPSLPAWAW